MAGHLDVLMVMFPNKIMLETNDIAKCLGVSKQHIYNLCSPKSGKTFPLKLNEDSGRIQVSIVEMARYLDSKLDGSESKQEKQTDLVVVEVKKKGRPRGSSARLHMAFQAQLSLSIMQEEIQTAFNTLSESIDEIKYVDDELACAAKVETAKNDFHHAAKFAKSYLDFSVMSMRFGMKTKEKTKPNF